jgi:hypothetical protein
VGIEKFPIWITTEPKKVKHSLQMTHFEDSKGTNTKVNLGMISNALVHSNRNIFHKNREISIFTMKKKQQG